MLPEIVIFILEMGAIFPLCDVLVAPVIILLGLVLSGFLSLTRGLVTILSSLPRLRRSKIIKLATPVGLLVKGALEDTPLTIQGMFKEVLLVAAGKICLTALT